MQNSNHFSINLNNLNLFSRRAKLHPQKQRSKYICKPEAVVEAGNHFVWEFVTGRGSLNVPADAGILHHYRVRQLVMKCDHSNLIYCCILC